MAVLLASQVRSCSLGNSSGGESYDARRHQEPHGYLVSLKNSLSASPARWAISAVWRSMRYFWKLAWPGIFWKAFLRSMGSGSHLSCQGRGGGEEDMSHA
eukprot:7385250-Prymnesium_polylepis.2